MNQQVLRPATLTSQPSAGSFAIGQLAPGDLLLPDSGWTHGAIQSGALAGQKGWLPTSSFGPLPAVPPQPSGIAMPVGDLPGWRQVFADDFNADVPLGAFPNIVNARWAAYPDGWLDTSRHGTYSPARVLEVSGGCLRWHIHAADGAFYVATPMPRLFTSGPPAVPYDRYVAGQLYGRYAVCCRSDSLAGYKTAFMLWPDSTIWPRDGEIDYPESNLDATRVGAYMHRQEGSGPTDQDAYGMVCDRSGWHVYVLEWRKDSLAFILDGVAIGQSTVRVPNTPMHWNLQTETALSGPLPDVATAGVLEVDWVAAWAVAP